MYSNEVARQFAAEQGISDEGVITQLALLVKRVMEGSITTCAGIVQDGAVRLAESGQPLAATLLTNLANVMRESLEGM